MLPNKLQITHSHYHNNDLLKEDKATCEAGHLKPSPPKKNQGVGAGAPLLFLSAQLCHCHSAALPEHVQEKRQTIET